MKLNDWDLPNEFGVPNHRPNVAEEELDKHDTVTGSTAVGQLTNMTKSNTCNDWGWASGVNIHGEGGPAEGDLTIGAGGGYGGSCFALTP
jgi:hypothetical protein